MFAEMNEFDVVRLNVDETYDFLTMVRNARRRLAGTDIRAGLTEHHLVRSRQAAWHLLMSMVPYLFHSLLVLPSLLDCPIRNF